MNQETKWMAASRTIIAAAVMFLVAVGPSLGLHFSQDDADLITQSWDKIIIAVSAVVVVWGRFKASTKLTIMPKSSGSKLNAHPLATVLALGLALVLVAACTTTPAALASTPKQKLYAVKSSYATYLDAAAQYAAQPFCTDTVVVACADRDIVAKLNDASMKVALAINVAEPLVDASPQGGDKVDKALATAQVGLRALISVLATTKQGA